MLQRKAPVGTKEDLGLIGEKIVINKLSSLGPVLINPNKYGYWDIEYSNEKIQVKTLTAFVKFNCWAITDKGFNIKNLFQNDWLYIVSIPTIKPHPTDGKLLRIKTSKLINSFKVLQGSFNPTNTRSLIIDRDANYIEVISNLDENELLSLKNNAMSYYN